MKEDRDAALPISPHDALRWHIEMGVDELIDDQPIDRYAAAAIPRAAVAVPSPSANSQPARPAASASPGQPLAPSEGARDAIAIARDANSIEDLRERLETFEGCALKFTATNTVFADGDPASDVMFIGEAPPTRPPGTAFVGASGQLPNRMLSASDASVRQSIFRTFCLAAARQPQPTAAKPTCSPPCNAISSCGPKVLVFLGGSSAKTMLNRTEGIMRPWKMVRLHGEELGTPIPAMPTFHPAFLLRWHKREAWRDFLAIQKLEKSLSVWPADPVARFFIFRSHTFTIMRVIEFRL